MKRTLALVVATASLAVVAGCSSGEPQEISCRSFLDLSEGERARVLQSSAGLRSQVSENADALGGQDTAWGLLVSAYSATCRRDGYEDKLVFSLSGTDLRARPATVPTAPTSGTRTVTRTTTAPGALSGGSATPAVTVTTGS